MEYLDTYIKTLEITGDYSENTIHAYSSDLKRFFQYLEIRSGHGPKVAELNSDLIKEFLENEKKSGFSASTLHRRKVVLSRFLHYLSRTGNFSKSDLFEVIKWKQNLWEDIYNREIQYLETAEINRLLAILNEEDSAKAIRDRSIISLMLETGLSIGKIVALDMDDLDLDAEKIHVSNKSAGDGLSITGSGKLLREYILSGRKQFIQSVNEPALFLSQMGGRISRQGVWQLVKDWGIKADLGVSLSPRILRNTKIKQMVRAGLPIAEIQKKLGHRNRYSTRSLIRRIKRNR